MTDRPSPLSYAMRPAVIRPSLGVCIIVGTLLNLINQGDALFGDKPIIWWKVVLTYAVPYCVATYGAITALARSEDNSD